MKAGLITLSVVSGLLITMRSTLAAEDHSQHRHDAQHGQPTESERAHVPPDPPQHTMSVMTEEQMVELMQMDDDAPLGMLRLDRLEWHEAREAQVWDAQAWYGRDYDKLWLKTEGERIRGEESGRVELSWDRILSRWWSLQAGARQDFGTGDPRTWAAVGFQGIAPYFFEIDATLYASEEGRVAARLSVEYDILVTQRLILQPQLELEGYSKDDPENGIGSGLSDLELGLRLRYELSREAAPYVGVQWTRKLGNTSDLMKAAGSDESEVSVVVGLRAWF